LFFVGRVARGDGSGSIFLRFLPSLTAHGTVKALQKYLELQPNGPYAPQARHFLVVLNTNVEGSYGMDKGTSAKQ